MTSLPDLVFVIDTNGEELAVQEAKRTHIPLMAIVDTNCDPDPIDYVIPSNDDSHRPIRYIAGIIAHAVKEGSEMREKSLVADAAPAEDERVVVDEIQYDSEELDDVNEEDLLGPGVLKRIAEEAEDGAAPEAAA